MCGISGIVQLAAAEPVSGIGRHLGVMNRLLAHRGPDAEGIWVHPNRRLGLAHRRLSIIDLSAAATQPLADSAGNRLVFNGEIFNHRELRTALAADWQFQTTSDTECILAAYARHREMCLDQLRGMFAFALWDEPRHLLFCARDRLGIKPFYYTVVDGVFYFASEAKALLPFLPEIRTNDAALAEYLTFQFTIGEKTLFDGIRQLLPGHAMRILNGEVQIWRYWDVHYEVDFDHSPAYFERRLVELVDESLALHLRADVPVGACVSGGIDSTLLHALGSVAQGAPLPSFHGCFREYPGYDESAYAEAAAARSGAPLHIAEITAEDFRCHIGDVIYHLDFPVAGPGSFAQFMVSRLASRHVKVVLGGQGGDEIFGGYARYVVAYFEQCIKAAIDGTYQDGNYVVTIESIIPNLGLLREYKPLIREFWRAGLFDPLDQRYFRLVDRASDMQEEIDWAALDRRRVFEDFSAIFNNTANVRKEAYFDRMTHFDFKTLLPALLHVEDRMSMAHGLESRVPLLDHPLIEFAATVPADVKFKAGNTKHLLKSVFANHLPPEVLQRRDKMGFPVPIKEWFAQDLRKFAAETFRELGERRRPYIHAEAVLRNFGQEERFSRKFWGLLSLELWHQQFHDRAESYRDLLRAMPQL